MTDLLVELFYRSAITRKDICSRRIQAHIHEGEFISKFPLIPGHEAVGTIVAMGDKVKGFDKGDRIAADVGGEWRRFRPLKMRVMDPR